MPLTRTHVDAITQQVEDVLTCWDGSDEVDTNLGVEIEDAGRDLADLLNNLADSLPRDHADHADLRTELTAAAASLHEVVDAYADLPEHDTNYCIDIIDRLGPGIVLANRAAQHL